MGTNKNNYNERGELISYELYDAYDDSSPFPHEQSRISPERFAAEYKSFVGKYPFKPNYIGVINPYTKKKVETKEDYYQYLREHCYLHICDSYVDSERYKSDTYVREANTKLHRAQSRIESLEKELSASEHNHTVLIDRNSALDAKWKDTSSRLTRTRRIAWLLVALLAISIFFGIRTKNNAYSSGQKSGKEIGYSEGISKLEAAVEEESARAYEQGERTGYKAGYEAGQTAGYTEGYGDGESTGYQNGYSAGLKSSYAIYTPQPSTSSGSHSGGDSTGTHRDTPISNSYIGNKNSHKFHLPTCSYLPDQGNQVIFDSRDEAISAGYSPCGHCKP